MTILLTGKTGQVGWELQRALAPLGRVIALDRKQMDLTDADSIRKSIRDAAPGIIVNAAGYTTVDKAESEPDLAMQINAAAPGVMAEEAKRVGALLVHYSTDYVFDGTRSTPYVEEDAPNPVNIYGKSKLEGERAIAAAGCAHLILRASWIYSARRANFVLAIIRLARERQEISVVDDQIGSPAWARALAESTTELLQNIRLAKEQSGIYHLSAQDYTTRFNFARRILEIAREISRHYVGAPILRPIASSEYPLPAARPLNVRTSKDKIKRVFGVEMPGCEGELRAFLNDMIANTAGKSMGEAAPLSN